ncbi:trypsin-like serine protease [Streptomyces roseolilacinus]|uniref:Hydrolase n=1 Tax=Streptomyces roseolilacinus TaxID=66904 RepID=A0A918EPI2_9ACTN|nr:trypsin-like serine protease [Streptomyces roseolilacinus]GGQ27810.1 hydrolase [Streptomyces roseolilacinus]
MPTLTPRNVTHLPGTTRAHRRYSAWLGSFTAIAVITPVALGGTSVHAVSGTTVTGDTYAFTAKIQIGEGDAVRACSGALVDSQWVLTAASCFTGGEGTLAPGSPALKAVATIGRQDLTTTAGHVTEIPQLVPHPGRDLVMARLATPTSAISPVPLSTTPPAAGDILGAAGYGRTQSEWIPRKLHTATFSAEAVSSTTISITGRTSSDAICKGDTGGPLLRPKDSAFEIVGINVRSWQGGCLGETETRTGALSTRVDDVAPWIQQLRLAPLVQQVSDVMTVADFNSDGRQDIATVLTDGSLHAFYGRADGALQYGRELWHDKGWGRVTKIVGGDFNGDGKADIAAISPLGALLLYPGTGHDTKLGAARSMWSDNTWDSSRPMDRYKVDGTGRDGIIVQAADGSLLGYPSQASGALTGGRVTLWPDKTWNKRLIAAGDMNGDIYDDVIAVAQDGKLHLYPGNAERKLGAARLLWHDTSWSGMKTVLAGDVNGDRKGDLLGRVNAGGLYWYAGDASGALAPGRLMWPTTASAN